MSEETRGVRAVLTELHSAACAGRSWEKAELGQQRQQQLTVWWDREAGASQALRLTKKVLSLSETEIHYQQFSFNTAQLCTFWPNFRNTISISRQPNRTRYYVFSQTIPVTANPASLTWRDLSKWHHVKKSRVVSDFNPFVPLCPLFFSHLPRIERIFSIL